MNFKLTQLLLTNNFSAPQIPDRMVWTASSIKLFRKCKRKWFWKYIMRLRPRFKDKNLLIGGAFHNSLGEWYRGKRADMGAIVNRYTEKLWAEVEDQKSSYTDQEDYDKLTQAVETFAGMVMGYAEVYSDDRAQWQIERKSIEAQFKVDLGPFDYSGKVDLVAGTPRAKRKRVVEHKTSSSIRSSYVDRLPMDTQVRGYVLGATLGLGITGVNEVLYDVVRKPKLRRKSNEDHNAFTQRIRNDYMERPDFYFYREPLKFTQSDVEALKYELHQTHAEYLAITKQAWADKDAAKHYFGLYGDPTDPRSWTPNDSSCDDFFRSCEYSLLCNHGLDKGTGRGYEQNEHMHEELVPED